MRDPPLLAQYFAHASISEQDNRSPTEMTPQGVSAPNEAEHGTQRADQTGGRMIRSLLSSLRVRLMVLVVLVLLPAFGLILYDGIEERRIEVREAQRNALQLARRLAEEQDDLIQGAHQLLVGLAELPSVRSREPVACSALFADIMKRFPLYANLAAASASGEVFCSGLPRRGPVNIADRSYFRRALRTKDFVAGEYLIGRLTGKRTLNLAYPSVNYFGSVQAVVFVALDLAWVNRLVAQVKLPEGSAVGIIDREGTILAHHPDSERWVGTSAAATPLGKAVLAQEEGILGAAGLDGLRRLHGFTSLKGWAQGINLHVWVGVTEAAALAEPNRLLARNLMWLGLAAALTLFAAWMLGDLLILRGMNSLVDTARRLAAGELAARTRLPHTGEGLGELARAVDNMAEALEKRQIDTHRAEEALRESENKYRALVNEIGDGVFETDAHGVLTFATQALARILGVESPERAIGRNFLEFVAPDQVSTLRARFARAVEAGESAGPVEVGLVQAPGGSSFVEVRPHLIFEGNKVVGTRGIIQDVTGRRKAEEALRQSEERYRDLVENATDIIYRHDMDGHFTSINKAAERVTGYTREEALTMTIDQIVAPEHRTLLQSVMERREAEARPITLELEIVTKGGKRVALEVNPRLIFEGGQAVGVQGIARDVSERKRLEDQLRQAQKLEAVGLLAGGVAHDFNNILNGIIGFAELALRELPAGSAERRYLSRVPQMGRQAADLIGQLLAFARKAPLERRPVDLNLVLRETAKMLQRTLPETLAIRAEPAGEPLIVEADLAQAQQILLNLATNARDAMPQGGTLTLRLAPISLTRTGLGDHPERRPGDFACLTVSDTGMGIPAANRGRIFEPFFTTKGPGEGTGLGLASVYGIVHQHDGWIEVESAEGQGSAFHVFLPRLSLPAPVAEEPAAPICRGTETVLLVEDNPMVRELGETLLGQLGYAVVSAPDGYEAMKAFRARSEVALVLTDAVMPRMGAAELIPALRALRPEVKVLVATGYASEEIRGALDHLRPQGYIWKPFRLADLAAAVRAALDGHGSGECEGEAADRAERQKERSVPS